MKKSQWIYILFALLLVLSSCKELFVTTKVNKDGSFTRLITITGDSAEIINSTTPYPIDISWEKQFSKDTKDSSKYILTYSKLYKNSDILNSEIQHDTSTMKNFKRKIEIKKEFGFFYSYLTFTETYLAYNPFTKMDYKKYMTEEDIDWLTGNTKAYSHADSLKLEKAREKQDNFMINAATEEAINGLKEGAQKLNEPGLTTQLIDQYSDSLKDWISKDILSDTAIFELLQERTGIAAFSNLKELEPPVLQEYNESLKKLLIILEFEEFNQIVEMPGIITETNSSELKGNQVEWKVNSDSFLYQDDVMFVESRIVNYWAFILTGIVFLLLIVVLLLKGFRK